MKNVWLVGTAWAGMGLMLLAGAPSRADDKKDLSDFIEKPGPEHQFLVSLVGVFDASVKFYLEPGKDPMVNKGTLKRTMILDGRFLREDFTGAFGKFPFAGQGTIAYDQKRKQYVSTWIDNMSTSIMISHGAYDADKKIFTSLSEDLEGDKKIHTKDVLRVVNDQEQTLEMFRRPEGQKAYFKVMEIKFTRVKK